MRLVAKSMATAHQINCCVRRRIDWDSAVPPRTSVAAAAAAVQFAKKSVGTHQSGTALPTQHLLYLFA